ncbi:hypothetical protein ACQJ6S_07040 [Helicobacter pylori]
MEKLIKDLESKKNTMAVDLKFGETFTAHYNYKCQNLIEVEVKTDKGTWTFNFNR